MNSYIQIIHTEKNSDIMQTVNHAVERTQERGTTTETERLKYRQSCRTAACLGLEAFVQFVRRHDSERDN